MGHTIWSARGEWRERRSLIVELETTTGIIGIGEASPLPGYSAEDIDAARLALETFCAAKLPTLDLDDPVEAARSLARFHAPKSPSARFAIETACLDAIARTIGCGLAALFESGSRTARATSLVSLFEPEPRLSHAIELGITSFKCKIGRLGEFDRELAALGRLRTALPTGAHLRVDVNGAWSPAQATQRILAVADQGATLVEQPCAPADMAKLLPGPVPIAVDESLASGVVGDELGPLIESGQIAAFVIKPAIVGGLAAAWDLARVANRAGVVPIISHLLDGPVALAACAELAVATDSSLAAGLECHQGLAAWPAISIPQFVGGEIRTCGKGLGVFT